ncbi:acyltransferase family protein [Actinomadura yumaensis]|uniref:Acyltransferase family protein n=1 Tax=Actinomadura yumaensis TaxID=111807 RepID=A0ABW2CGD5_9ACTN
MTEPPRLRELDLLRFVAATAVMLHHFVGRIAGWGVDNHHNLPVLARLTHFGGFGVDLFFLISGFVILMSAWDRGVGDFAVSRVARIFPAYWFAVSLALLLFFASGASLFEDGGGIGPLRSYLPNMTMLNVGIGVPPMEVVYWTLWAELHFYALAALLVWRGITYDRCVAFMVLWLLLGVFAREGRAGLLNGLLMPEWAPLFIAGMGFYLVYRFGPNLVLGLVIAACWALTVYYRVTIVNRELVWPQVWDAVATGVVTFLFLLMLMVATGSLGMVRRRGFTALGALTYPLYLIHETLARVMVERLGPHLGRWPLLAACCAVALGGAHLVYRFVEQPAQRWMRPRLRGALEQIRNGDGAPPDRPATARRPAAGPRGRSRSHRRYSVDGSPRPAAEHDTAAAPPA